MSTHLSVNLNKVALVRNTRHLGIPSVTHAATLCLQAGADGITVHPRPDERHIRRGDVFDLAALLKSWPAAEFNIYVDPHAAQLVFASGIPLVVMPLDVTHQVLTTRKRLDAMDALGTPVARATVEMLEFFERFDEEKYGSDGGPLHDPCVIAYLLQPDLFQGRHCNVEIETSSELTMGMTVVDWWGVTARPKNATVMRTVDADGFFSLLTARLKTL